MSSEPAIHASKLCVSYPDGTAAFHEVDLTVQAEECIGLVGPNGAGKTSLLFAICGILAPQRGELRIFGLDPGNQQQRLQLPRLLGMVMQQSDHQLFNPTVLDDVSFGPLNMGCSKSEARARAEAALTQVNLAGFSERVPHRLSGGEKRRVALAGILAMQPKYLLLDEPTQDLDPRGRRELIAILKDLPQGKLIASHDLEFIQEVCSRTIVFDQTVIADGQTKGLLSQADLMERHGLEVPANLR